MKQIKLKAENRGQGMATALDKLWDSWKLLEGGTFIETASNFTLTNTVGDSFVASKTDELSVARMYNRFIDTDLRMFKVYEGQNPTGGYFILYHFKDPDRQNEFIISSIGGVAEGSSIVFELLNSEAITSTIKKTTTMFKKPKLNGDHLAMLWGAFAKNLFIRPGKGDIIACQLAPNCPLYFKSDYYEKLKLELQEAYNQGRFAEGNAQAMWEDLLQTFIDAEDKNEIDRQDDRGRSDYYTSSSKHWS